MTLQAAIATRISDLCQEKGIAPDTFPSSTDDLAVVEDICYACGISLADFFRCDTFRNIEKA